MKKRKIIILLLILLSIPSLFSVDLWRVSELSSEAEISLVTCGPGPFLYAVFGHSTIRIKDPAQDIDWIVNWGTFDFNTDYFLYKFIRGRLDYMVNVVDFKSFYRGYVFFDRTIVNQQFNLTRDQKNQVLYFVQVNNLPENRFYQYDFFKDNCATRIGELFMEEFPEHVRFPEAYSDSGTTFQKMLQPYLKAQKWTALGMNIILGLESNKSILNYQQMYLPYNLRYAFEDAQVYRAGEWIPLIEETEVLYSSKGIFALEAPPFYLQPISYALLLFLGGLVVFYLEWKGVEKFLFINIILFTILTVLSIFLLVMWFFTDHSAVTVNANLFWTLPWIWLIKPITRLLPSHKKQIQLIAGVGFPIIYFVRPILFTAHINIALVPMVLFIILRNVSSVLPHTGENPLKLIHLRSGIIK